MAGCGSGPAHTTTPASPSGPSSPPASSSTSFSVASITPASGVTQVALNATIQIAFSAAANASTVNTTDITVSDPKAVAGTVTYNSSNNTATFTPSAALIANSTYTVTVSGVTSSSGTAMASAFVSTFATVSQSSSGGGGSSSPTLQYEATLENGGTTNYGQISMDTTGKMTVQLTGAVANVQFTVEFCPAYYSGDNQPNCFNVGGITSDANGNASTTMMFPQSGSWAGDFQLTSTYVVAPGTTAGYSTDIVGNDKNQSYMSTLQPINTVNGGILGSKTPQAQLTSGTVTYTNGSLQFVLNGAPADLTFTSSENGDGLGSSDSYMLYNSQNQSGFTTDSQGNLTFTVLQDGVFGDLFEVSAQSSYDGYLGGFSVPK